MLTNTIHLALVFDGQPKLSLTAPEGEFVFELTGQQLQLIVKRGTELLFYHYDLVRPEGQL